VLVFGNGKTKTGRLGTYVGNDRPAGDTTPPVAYTPDRTGQHLKARLSSFTGTLPADDYGALDQFYQGGRIHGAGC
jgi:hypothetical protein